ncbi:hypothetical protein NE237_020924 [Protea cynaroides]|uniref:Cell morphogenesis central region domain-containing protein n=1 Tax=Protea cynaroides TaxID=273540 RepID=A0A9Q0HC54_9MAGN|nr:hypothetical protein NE237_020924 [Protea cynaroides]
MDSSEDIVLEHSQQLLVNLLYSLAGWHLELYEVESNDGGNKQQAVSMIKYVQSKHRSMMWENEVSTVVRTELPIAALLSAFVQSMVDAIFFQGDFRETFFVDLWGGLSAHPGALHAVSIRTIMHCDPASQVIIVSLLRCVPSVLGFIMEILLTLQVMVENMEPSKITLAAQQQMCCSQACPGMSLIQLAVIFDLQRMESRIGSKPLPANSKVPAFEGVQPLVLKGLKSTVSHGSSIELTKDSPASPLQQQYQRLALLLLI